MPRKQPANCPLCGIELATWEWVYTPVPKHYPQAGLNPYSTLALHLSIKHRPSGEYLNCMCDLVQPNKPALRYTRTWADDQLLRIAKHLAGLDRRGMLQQHLTLCILAGKV